MKTAEQELNDLIQDHIPEVYRDGDVRHLGRNLYRQIALKFGSLARAKVQSHYPDRGEVVLRWRGPWGVIWLKPAEGEQ